MVEHNKKGWLKKYGRECKWANQLDGVPEVICECYKRLRFLAEEDDVYGIQMELKQFYELIIKIPVTIAVIIIDNADYKGDRYGIIMKKLLADTMSMGNWEALAKELLHEDLNGLIPENLVKIINNTIDLFKEKIPPNYGNVVNWRNKEIGHGVVHFADDPGLIDGVKTLLSNLYEYFDGTGSYSVRGLYKGIDLCLHKKEEIFDLSLTVDTKEGKMEYDTSNYVDKSRPYCLFDTYYSKNMKCQYTSCIERKCNNIQRRYFDDLYRKYVLKPGNKKSNRIITRDAYNYLELLYSSEDYVIPRKLLESVKLCLNGKGIIGLFMERGTGKTAFSNRLSNYAYKKIQLEDSIVRCYHLSNASVRGKNSFFNFLNREFLSSHESKDDLMDMIGGNLPRFNPDNEDRATELANFLNNCREIFEDVYDKKKLVLVLDGIDEINDRASLILDCLPTEEMLDENVFILVTSRFEDEENVEGSSRTKIQKIQSLIDPKKIIEVRRYSEINVEALKSYIRKKTAQTCITDEEINMLIQKSDYRFLFLRVFLDIVTDGLNTDNIFSFIDSYMGYVLSLNSHIVYKNPDISEIAAAIALFSGITIEQFKDYVEFFEPNPEFMGQLNDLMPLLEVTHRDGENAFEYANEEYARYILDKHPDAVTHIIRSFIAYTIDNARRLTKHEGEFSLTREGLIAAMKLDSFCTYALDSLCALAERYDYIRELIYGEDHFSEVVSDYFGSFEFMMPWIKEGEKISTYDSCRLLYDLSEFRKKVFSDDQKSENVTSPSESEDAIARRLEEDYFSDPNEGIKELINEGSMEFLRVFKYLSKGLIGDEIKTPAFFEAISQSIEENEKKILDIVTDPDWKLKELYRTRKGQPVYNDTADSDYAELLYSILNNTSDFSPFKVFGEKKSEEELYIYMTNRLHNLKRIAQATGFKGYYVSLCLMYREYIDYLMERESLQKAMELLLEYVNGTEHYQFFIDHNGEDLDLHINKDVMEKYPLSYCSEYSLLLIYLLHKSGQKDRLAELIGRICEDIPKVCMYYPDKEKSFLKLEMYIKDELSRIREYCENGDKDKIREMLTNVCGNLPEYRKYYRIDRNENIAALADRLWKNMPEISEYQNNCEFDKMSDLIRKQCEEIPKTWRYYYNSVDEELFFCLTHFVDLCKFVGIEADVSNEDYAPPYDECISEIKETLEELSFGSEIDMVYSGIDMIAKRAYYLADYDMFDELSQELSALMERKNRYINDMIGKWMQEVRNKLTYYEGFFDLLKKCDETENDGSKIFLGHKGYIGWPLLKYKEGASSEDFKEYIFSIQK